ncbi:MAG: SDR family oxidoreductase [Candidatus Eremiobacteraeota bacterium]|nr:SDR family oxidoreductase [Candidatus Eremiobacteraeota bacterium]
MHKKIAVVTGGSSGIGKAFVEKLARLNYRVYTISRRSGHYKECGEEWAQIGNIAPVIGDIRYGGDVKSLVKIILDNEKRLDLLINNAGIYVKEDGAFPSLDVFIKNIETNLIAHYQVILESLALMEKSKNPIIINITSGAGAFSETNSKGPLAYRVSKAAANMLTKSLSFDLKEKNIAIHAVDPGWVNTKMNPNGIDTPEKAVNGMLFLTKLHDLDKSGYFWRHGNIVQW